jgi:hypothetical protein
MLQPRHPRVNKGINGQSYSNSCGDERNAGSKLLLVQLLPLVFAAPTALITVKDLSMAHYRTKTRDKVGWLETSLSCGSLRYVSLPARPHCPFKGLGFPAISVEARDISLASQHLVTHISRPTTLLASYVPLTVDLRLLDAQPGP